MATCSLTSDLPNELFIHFCFPPHAARAHSSAPTKLPFLKGVFRISTKHYLSCDYFLTRDSVVDVLPRLLARFESQLWCKIFLQIFQTACGAHLACCSMDTLGCFLEVNRQGCVTNYSPSSIFRLRMDVTIYPLPLNAFMTHIKGHLLFLNDRCDIFCSFSQFL
jgi:hypothetical protein